jgi:FMN reductase (NADPH)
MEPTPSMETNPTLELIHSHVSVRAYRPDPLPARLIETVVAAGQCASTSSNMQVYSVIAVTGQEKRNRLAELCGSQEQIRQAPVFLAWYADLARLDHACALRGYTQETGYVENFLVAAVDTSLAAQTAALAAESLGLGICYIGSIRNHPQEVIDLLEMPRLTFPVTGMTLGWPAGKARVRPRLPLTAVLHLERDERQNEEQDLQQYDREMLATGIYQGRQVPVPGRAGEIEQYSWSEHSARRVSQALRTELRSILEKQGFSLR